MDSTHIKRRRWRYSCLETNNQYTKYISLFTYLHSLSSGSRGVGVAGVGTGVLPLLLLHHVGAHSVDASLSSSAIASHWSLAVLTLRRLLLGRHLAVAIHHLLGRHLLLHALHHSEAVVTLHIARHDVVVYLLLELHEAVVDLLVELIALFQHVA